uniref:Odorant receptor n=1 Tax=Athetis lepigone TaxID=1223490 RepID=A0A1B3B761_ATHLE|nr:putative odorant receptor OR20 [Athetis lepigone]
MDKIKTYFSCWGLHKGPLAQPSPDLYLEQRNLNRFDAIRSAFKSIINPLRYLLGTRAGEAEDLVTLICSLIHNTGLSSYITLHKVHWAANLSTFCFVTTCITQVVTIFMAKDDPEKLFECFSVLAFCGMGVLKLISLRKSHQNWRKILTEISKLENSQLSKNSMSDADCQSDNNEECVNFSDYIKNYTYKFRHTTTILTRIYSFTAVVFIVSPFVEHNLCKMRGLECQGYPHILPGWSPLDAFSDFGYVVTVLCELLASVYCVCVHIAFDLTAIGIMIFVCGQYSCLRDFSSRIGGSGKQCKLSKKRDKRAHISIKRCHQINMVLVSSITELDKLLSNIIGVYFFLATLTLCSVAVRLKSVDVSIMQLVSLIQYMCGTLTQLFLFCRYGDAVLHESSLGMGQGPFAAAYWSLSPRVRRELTMLGAGMMTSRHLRAGPFNHLDLPSFILIVRTAYSYYAVLGKKE